MAKTRAEIQKAYRDRQRLLMAEHAKLIDVETRFMAQIAKGKAPQDCLELLTKMASHVRRMNELGAKWYG